MEQIFLNREQQYIQELKQDSQEAFNALYRIYCRRLYAFVYQYVKIKEDAEDIIQDAFCNLWYHRKSIQKEDSLKSYLFQTVKNSLINRMKANINSFPYEEYVSAQSEPATERDSSSKHLEYEDFQKVLSAAMLQLPKGQRQVVDYHLLQNLSIAEIAQMLQVSEQTVRNQYSTGIKFIRKKLQVYGLTWIVLWFLMFSNHL